MKILKEMQMGNVKWILAKMEEEFYGWGTPVEFNSAYGLPVNQCGLKEEVLRSLESRADRCKKAVSKYRIESQKDSSEGWERMIAAEKNELEMLLAFARTLRGFETEDTPNMREYLSITLGKREQRICLPTSEDQLNRLLGDHKKVLVTDWDGPYPINGDYADIRKINQDIQQFIDQGLSEDEVRTLFKASDLPEDETAELILKGDYLLMELGSDTDSWQMSLKEKAALAICSSYQVVPAIAEAFEKNGGNIPDDFIGYINWDRVWRECIISGWKLIRDAKTGSYWVCNI